MGHFAHFICFNMQYIVSYHSMKLQELLPYKLEREEITPKQRTILMGWILEVTSFYGLNSDCLFACKEMIDEFLARFQGPIPLHSLQPLGAACLLRATEKYDVVTKLSYANRNFSPVDEVISLIPNQNENEFLDVLRIVHIFLGNTTFVTYSNFLNLISKMLSLELDASHRDVYRLTLCLLELSILNCNLTTFNTSTVTLAAVFIALQAFELENEIPILLNLENDLDEISECMELLVSTFHEAYNSQPFISDKYCNFSSINVSTIDLSEFEN